MTMVKDSETSFANLLLRVLKDDTTNFACANKTFLISCSIDYYFPLFLLYKENSVLNEIKIDDTVFYNVKFLYVSITKENDTYMILSYDNYYDEKKHISFNEFNDKFPRGTIIKYEDYKKYEEEFYHFKTTFEFEDDCSVKIV